MATVSASIPPAPGAITGATNPPFDKRFNVVGAFQSGKQLRVRGSIFQALPRAGVRYGVNFLRNPSAVSFTHGLDDTLNTDPNAHDLNDVTSVLPVTTQSSISLSLLFDRTFETLDNSYKGQSVHTQGVYTDMAAFYRMLGMLQPTTVVGEGDKGSESYSQKLNVDKAAAPSADDPAKAPTLSAPMQYVSCNLFLGGPLRYFGIINGFNISITQWTVNMVPVRAAIDIGFTILPESTLDAQDKGESEAQATRNVSTPGHLRELDALNKASKPPGPIYGPPAPPGAKDNPFISKPTFGPGFYDNGGGRR